MTSIFFRHKILSGFVWKPENARERKNKQMRKIIFLDLDNLENSKGKNVEEKRDLLAYSPSPIFFSCSFDSGFAFDHLCSSIFFNNLIFLVKVRLL